MEKIQDVPLHYTKLKSIKKDNHQQNELDNFNVNKIYNSSSLNQDIKINAPENKKRKKYQQSKYSDSIKDLKESSIDACSSTDHKPENTPTNSMTGIFTKQKRIVAKVHKTNMELIGAGTKFIVAETFKNRSEMTRKIDKIAERLLKNRQDKYLKNLAKLQCQQMDDRQCKEWSNLNKNETNQEINGTTKQVGGKSESSERITPIKSLPNILSKSTEKLHKSAPQLQILGSKTMDQESNLENNSYTTFVPYVEGTSISATRNSCFEEGRSQADDKWEHHQKSMPPENKFSSRKYISANMSVTQMHSFPYLSKFTNLENLTDPTRIPNKNEIGPKSQKNFCIYFNTNDTVQNYRIVDELNLSARPCFSSKNKVRSESPRLSTDKPASILATKSEIKRGDVLPTKKSDPKASVNDCNKGGLSNVASSTNSPDNATVLKKLTFLKDDGRTTTYTYQPILDKFDMCNIHVEDHKYTRAKEESMRTLSGNAVKDPSQSENSLLSTISRSSGQIAFIRSNSAMARNKTQYYAVKCQDKIVFMPTNDSTYSRVTESNISKNKQEENILLKTSNEVQSPLHPVEQNEKEKKNGKKLNKTKTLQKSNVKSHNLCQSIKVSTGTEPENDANAIQNNQNRSKSTDLCKNKTVKIKKQSRKKRFSKPRQSFVSLLGLAVKSTPKEEEKNRETSKLFTYRGRQRHAAGTVYKTPIVKHADALRVIRMNNKFKAIQEKVVITLTNGSIEELKSFQKYADIRAHFIYEDIDGAALKYIEVDNIQPGFYHIQEIEDVSDNNTGTKALKASLRSMPAVNDIVEEKECFIAIGMLINLFSSQPCHKFAYPREIETDDIEPLLRDLLPANQHFRGFLHKSDRSYKPVIDSPTWYEKERYNYFTEMYFRNIKNDNVSIMSF